MVGLLFAITLANWVAISVHVSNLRHQAKTQRGDAGAELQSDASGYAGAKTLFGVLTIGFGFTFVAIGGKAVIKSLGARTAMRAAGNFR